MREPAHAVGGIGVIVLPIAEVLLVAVRIRDFERHAARIPAARQRVGWLLVLGRAEMLLGEAIARLRQRGVGRGAGRNPHRSRSSPIGDAQELPRRRAHRHGHDVARDFMQPPGLRQRRGDDAFGPGRGFRRRAVVVVVEILRDHEGDDRRRRGARIALPHGLKPAAREGQIVVPIGGPASVRLGGDQRREPGFVHACARHVRLRRQLVGEAAVADTERGRARIRHRTVGEVDAHRARPVDKARLQDVRRLRGIVSLLGVGRGAAAAAFGGRIEPCDDVRDLDRFVVGVVSAWRQGRLPLPRPRALIVDILRIKARLGEISPPLAGTEKRFLRRDDGETAVREIRNRIAKSVAESRIPHSGFPSPPASVAHGSLRLIVHDVCPPRTA